MNLRELTNLVTRRLRYVDFLARFERPGKYTHQGEEISLGVMTKHGVLSKRWFAAGTTTHDKIIKIFQDELEELETEIAEEVKSLCESVKKEEDAKRDLS